MDYDHFDLPYDLSDILPVSEGEYSNSRLSGKNYDLVKLYFSGCLVSWTYCSEKVL